jgi:predicted permease
MNLRHVLRRLAHSPAFTATTLLTLAIGIGANTAIFSVLDNVLLKPLPYTNPDSLVGVWFKSAPLHFEELNMSPSLYFVFRDESRTFSDIGLWSGGSVSVTGVSEPEQVPSLTVTDRTFPLLGIQPVLGRTFSKQDDSAGTPETVLLTYGYWQSKFGGRRDVLGRRIIVDGTSREIIGVLPAGFRFLDMKPSLITPFQFDRAKLHLGNFSFQGVARLRPGVTLAQANADITRMIPLSYDRYPPFPGYSIKMFVDAQITPALRPFKKDLVGDIGSILWVLMGTMGIVLLIACANVANLLLVRAEGRQHELAIRTALGASTRQIAGELLLESITLALAAGTIGVALAYFALRIFVASSKVNLPRLDEISINPEALLFTLVISLLAGLFFGVIPVIKYAGLRLTPSLRAGGRNSSQSRQQHRARNLLVVLQVALALVLLISSGLMIRTFRALRDIPPGFTNAGQVQTLSIYIPEAQEKNPEKVFHMQREILDRITAIPGVTSAAMLGSVPMGYSGENDPIFAEDHTYAEGQIPAIRRYNFVSPGLFKTLGNGLIAGRDFTWNDISNYQPVAILSENIALELWGTPSAAIGKRIRESTATPWRTVIGVVHDSYDNGISEKKPFLVYWPSLMKNFEGDDIRLQRGISFAIRSDRAGSQQFLNALRQAVWSVDAAIPLADVNTLQYYYDKSLARTSLALMMLAIAGAMALLLGIVGIYGVISYSVTQRTREIGIRLAIGAQQHELTRMFVNHGLILSAIGVTVGLIVAFLSARFMSSLLFGVKPVDPLTYALVAIGLITCALLASYIPARRASTIDPSESLRAE